MDNCDISQMLSESHNEIDACFEGTSLGQCENCGFSIEKNENHYNLMGYLFCCDCVENGFEKAGN